MITKMDLATKVVRDRFFQLFDKALEIGHGVTCHGDFFQCTDPRLHDLITGLHESVCVGPAFLVEWQDERGDRMGQREFLDNGADVFDTVMRDLLDGRSDKLFNCGSAFPMLEVGPGLMTVIGAPPGRGKTALAMQVLYDAVANERGLQAVVAFLEVTAATLIKRRMAMLLGVNFDAIRFNTLTQYQR